jgi:hypothetical protein
LRRETLRTRAYNPGQYKTRGAEGYARKLYASRYGSKSPNAVFLIEKVSEKMLYLKIKKTKIHFKLPLEKFVPSLRTYSEVPHIDITGEEEFALVDSKALPLEVIKLAGLIPQEKLDMAIVDIRCAHEDIASNVLLTRRTQLTSPGLYWLVFYSDNDTLSNAVLLNMRVKDAITAKILALYLNSTVAFIQLIAFVAETRGSWVDLHSRQEWGQVHVPDVENLDQQLVKRALQTLAQVSKIKTKTLYERIATHDKIQRLIDEIALDLLDLGEWKAKLDDLYDAVGNELMTMHKILETSGKKR